MNNANKQLKISYVNDVNTTYKVIEMGQEHELIDYQVDMIRNNQVDGLLKIDSRFVNNDLHLYYDVTSKQSLEDYMKRIQWGKKETLDFIEQLIQIILKAESYLLDSSSILIDSSNIYLDPQTRRLALVYLPVKMEQSINDLIKAFLIQWIVYDASFKKEETDALLSQLLNALKDSQFNLKTFQKEIGNMQIHQLSEKKENVPSVAKPKEKKKPESLETFIPDSQPVYQAPVIQKGSAIKHQEPKETAITYKTKKRFKKSVLLLAGISQVLICLVLALFGEKIIAFAGGDSTSFMGLGMLVLVIEALIFRRVFNVNSMEEVKISTSGKKSKRKQKKKNAVQHNDNRVSNSQPQGHDRIVMNKRVVEPVKVEKSAPVQRRISNKVVENETTLLRQEFSQRQDLEETTLLSELTMQPYLTFLSNTGMERIDLLKEQFIIGRQQGIVDYVVQENAIGRMHAEISTEHGCYYIKDLNSRNGTFLNGARLIGDQKETLNHGDVIKLANLDFTFNMES